MLYAVTVRLKKNPGHDPKNKITGLCPVSGRMCTDVTGEHHTFLADLDAETEEVAELYETIYHVTRVEEVGI